MPQYKLGKQCKAYFGDPETYGLSTENGVDDVISNWDEVDNIKDLTLTLSKGEADITTRGDGGWTALVPTLKNAEISFQMKWLPSDPFFAAVMDSFQNDTVLPFIALDGPSNVAGNQGLGAHYGVFSATRNEALSEGVMVDVTLKPSEFIEWYVVPETEES